MDVKQPLLVNTPPPVAPQVIIPSRPPQVILLNTVLQAQGNVPAAGNRRFKGMAGQITGGIQIVCAILSATFGILAILAMLCVVAKRQCEYNGNYNDERRDDIASIAWPIWGAVCFYMVAGIIGVSTGSKNTCVIVAYMVMSIIAASSAAGQLIMESLAAVDIGPDCGSHRAQDSYHYERICRYDYWNVSLALHCLCAIVAFVEMIVAILAAAYCCYGVCCRTTPQQFIVQYDTTPAPQFQTVHPPSGPPQYHDQVSV